MATGPKPKTIGGLQIRAVAEDPTEIRRAFACFPSGVTALCGLADGIPVGMAASAFTAVSIAPPLVSVCMQISSTTWPKLRQLPRLGVSMLARHQHNACRALSVNDGDRFTDVPWDASENGAVFVNEATAWLDCSVDDEVAAGDHVIALLAIHGLRADPDQDPLVFHLSRFRQLTPTS
ncbi:flavin reductase [Mycobacterium florentinum]|uniref:Flavin reductase n=1 Tax=Mycobacterium florentinum TaxID=292462 RepID=A0A1X1U8J2_MYCFL|nr:flavin reductase family protein [Mycobacterium florentinum]MCV7410627.1 flavin reductase family protein [Mycobacterium florentinum]ORV53144.1 flavin reductase [Mycobacterium florentinum]BBX79951.1 oxidoreductase [Mycobacterium florentinum]